MSESTPYLPVSTEQEPFEYHQLVGHARTDGSFKTSEQLRTEYVELTDKIVQQITHGVEVIDPETQEVTVEKPDYVIWLDKSARPVSWLTKELWPVLAADKEGNVPKMPAFRYVNIDREQWVNTIDPHGVGVVDINRVDKSILRSLRSIFVSPQNKTDGLDKDIDTMPSELDDKTVLIIDEVRSSSRTLNYARDFFRRAFPTARVSTMYWMEGQAAIGTAIGNADLPVWYKEKDVRGRGVNNRNERRSQRSPSLTQRLGGWFLSTIHEVPDPISNQLRKEIRQLGEDVRNHEVLVLPHARGPASDDFEERAERINGIDFETFVQKIQQQNHNNTTPRRPRSR